MALVWLLLAAAALYLGVVGLVAVLQGRLIYPAPPQVDQLPAGYTRVELQTSDGLTLAAGYRRASAGMPTIVFFHGNAMVWPDGIHVTDWLAAQGYGVMLAEYRGYNGNPGTPTEQGLYRDGHAALAFLDRAGIDGDEIVVVGLSVGSGVAVQMATEREIRALILVSPMASLPETARAAFPWLPVRRLLRDRYDNLSKIGQVRSPVLILHGADDRLIPQAHAVRLAEARKETELVVLPGRGHNMAADPIVQRLQHEFLSRSSAGN